MFRVSECLELAIGWILKEKYYLKRLCIIIFDDKNNLIKIIDLPLIKIIHQENNELFSFQQIRRIVIFYK